MAILDVHSLTLELRYSSMNSGEPKGVPRYGLPCEVMLTPESANMFAWNWSLVTNHVLEGLAK